MDQEEKFYIKIKKNSMPNINHYRIFRRTLQKISELNLLWPNTEKYELVTRNSKTSHKGRSTIEAGQNNTLISAL